MMKRLFGALIALTILATPTAQSYWQSRSQVSAVAAVYAGPLDVVPATAGTMWYGLRASRLAAIGTNAVRLVRASDSTETNIVTLADGSLDVATATTFCAATTCKAVTLYDQSGALACAGAACDVTQATDANRPAFTFNCVGSLPCLTFVAATAQLARANPAITAPWSLAVVAQRTANFTTFQSILGGYDGSSTLTIQFRNAANGANLAIPSAIALTTGVTDSAWHALQGVASSGANAVYDNGTNSITGQAGVPGNWAVNRIVIGATVFNATGLIGGLVTEAGVWGSKAFTATEANNLAANAKTYWGF